MFNRVLLLGLLSLAGFMMAPAGSSACFKGRTVCYSDCCYRPCCHHWCHCLAYECPYERKGTIVVRCDCCPRYVPSWQYCYIYKYGFYDWVKVYRCFPHGTRIRERNTKRNIGGPAEEQSKAPIPAHISVSLPADARLTIDGRATTSTSGDRAFVTPALEPGKSYVYTLEASLQRNGRELRIAKEVSFKPGEHVQVRFNLTADSELVAE